MVVTHERATAAQERKASCGPFVLTYLAGRACPEMSPRGSDGSQVGEASVSVIVGGAVSRAARSESLVRTVRPDLLSRKGLSRNVPEGFGWLSGGGGLGLGACWRSGVPCRQIGRCAEEVLAVVDQLGDALTDVVECAVRGQLLGTCRVQVVVPALAEIGGLGVLVRVL